MTRRAAISTHANQINAPLFRELARTNDDFHVLFLSEDPLGKPVFDSEMGIDFSWDVDTRGGFESACLPLPREAVLEAGLQDLRNVATQARRWISSVRPESVMLPSWSPVYASLLPSLRGNDVSIVFRGTCRVPRKGSTLRRVVADTAKKRFLAHVDAANFIGTQAREELLRLGFPAHRMVASPYGVDNSGWEARLSKASGGAVRRWVGAPPGCTVFLLVNKLIAKKGLDPLLPAVETASKLSDFRVVIVGEGSLRMDVETKITGLGLRDRVFLAGFRNQNELADYFDAADAFMLLSDDPSETWGLVINEAMVAGLPVVASHDAGATCDLVAHGLTGFRVDPRQPHELVEAILALTDRSIRDEMGENARRVIPGSGIVPAAQGVNRAFELALTRRK